MIVLDMVPVILKKRWLNGLMVTVLMAVTIHVACAESDKTKEITGEASYYSQRLIGKRTTSGEKYDDKAFTAAHTFHPFGTYLLITNLKNKQSVVVRVNDRFRPRKGHLVDVSMAAAMKIDLVRYGRGRITLRVLDDEEALSLMTELGQIERVSRMDSVTIPLPVSPLKPVPTTSITLLVPTDLFFP